MANEITGDEVGLLRLSVEFRHDECKELSENWRHLDTKAQGNVGISGILLAAVVAFLSKGQPLSGACDRALVTVAVLSLSATIVLAVRALRVRMTTAPPHFGSMQGIIDDLLKTASPHERSSRIGDLLREELGLWAECNDHTRQAVDSKAKLLSQAQSGILAATLTVSSFTLIRIFV